MPTVRKKDLVTEVSNQTNLNQKEAAAMLEAIVTSIAQSLIAGDDVALRGFGSFRLRTVRPRTARNPSRPTERVQIPAHCVIRFKPSPRLRSKVRELDPAKVDDLQESETDEAA